MVTKICIVCKEEKEDSEFESGRNQCKICRRKYQVEQKRKKYPEKRSQLIEYQKKYRAENKEKLSTQSKIRYKLNRTKILEEKHEYYIKNKTRIELYMRGYYKKNHAEILNKRKKYHENNREKILEQMKNKYWENREENIKKMRIGYQNNKCARIESVKRYFKTPEGKLTASRKEHKRRCLSKQTPCTLTLLQWEKILETQGNKCAICGKRFCKSRPPTKDHIVPLSKGGGLTFENVQALCHSCNSSKNAKLDPSKIITWSHHGLTT